MYKNVYIGLGSNMGDRKSNLFTAIEHIKHIPDTRFCRASGIYETEPVGYTKQDKFLNMVVAVETKLQPLELLNNLQQIEHFLRRTRTIRWGPRTIDLDILLFDNLSMDSKLLTIPHPRMYERAFVLIPLKDVWHGDSTQITKHIRKCADFNGVVEYSK